MIDEIMLPRKGLFNRKFSVLAQIRIRITRQNLADINSVRPTSSKCGDDRKETVPVRNCVASSINDTKRKLLMV